MASTKTKIATDFLITEVVRNMLEARGDLPAGTVDPEDIVDATLVRAYGGFSKGPAQGDIRSRLIRFALEIEAEVRRVKTEREEADSLEKGVPATPPKEEVTTLGEEILDFYQPDEPRLKTSFRIFACHRRAGN